ncbi:MAG: FAD-dependent oxidoreductase [bacterium]|nr:FAD-dependent oxidoreductase [bacterium]
MSRRIVILGAGVAGLAAAWKLLHLHPDDEVIVVERDQVPGGLAKSVEWLGYPLDLGPHRFHTEIPEIKTFIKSFCEERMTRVKRFSRMYLNGRYIPYPIKPLETFQCLGAANAVRYAFSAAGALFEDRDRDAVSYEEYVSRYYGTKLYERIFEPFARKVWGLDPKYIAAETARVRLRGESVWHALLDGLFSKEETYVAEFLYPPKGFGQIAEQFAEEIERRGGRFLYERTVKRIDTRGGAAAGVATDGPNGEEFIECDWLISTLPLPQAPGLLNPAAPSPVMEAAAELQYRAIVLLYLLYDYEAEFEDTWLYYPEEHVPFTRVSVPDHFNPARPRDGRTCLCVEFCCEYGDETWRAESDVLARLAQQTLANSGLVKRDFCDHTTVKIREGYPIYHVGYDALTTMILGHLRGLGNVITAGRQGLFRHNNIDQSIQMGLLAAIELSHQNGVDHWYDHAGRFENYRIVD